MSELLIDANDPSAIKEEIKEFINNYLQTDITPKPITKIDGNVNVIQIRNEEEKQKIISKKFKLRNLVGQRIYVNDDMTKQKMEKKKVI